MNLDEARSTDVFHTVLSVTGHFAVIFLGVVFWSALCVLASSPVWLPSLVETLLK